MNKHLSFKVGKKVMHILSEILFLLLKAFRYAVRVTNKELLLKKKIKQRKRKLKNLLKEIFLRQKLKYIYISAFV